MRNRDRAPPREVLAGQRLGAGTDVRRRALRHHLTAVHPGTGAHVDHVIGRHDRFFVMLDHDHGVTEIAQMHERAE